jgi:hypothetical protein
MPPTPHARLATVALKRDRPAVHVPVALVPPGASGKAMPFNVDAGQLAVHAPPERVTLYDRSARCTVADARMHGAVMGAHTPLARQKRVGVPALV